MALLTMGGGAESADQARAVLRACPFLADQSEIVLNEIAQILHETYPGTRWIDLRKRSIEPVEPDLLGEHLVQEELGQEPGCWNSYSIPAISLNQLKTRSHPIPNRFGLDRIGGPIDYAA